MNFSENKTIDVVGVGNALMDILVEVDDAFLTEHNLAKGEMHLVSEEEAEGYVESIKDLKTREIPGGSSANTVRGIAALGGNTTYFGAIGHGIYGSMYKDALKTQGVDTRLYENTLLTGNAITYITPDHDRTFTVHLGAAAELPLSLIDEEVIRAAKVVHIEAFQFEAGTRPVLEHVIKVAKENGTLVSLDLNDASLIHRNYELFREVVRDSVDILFVNETESEAFTGETNEHESLSMLSACAPIVVLKLGKRGSLIAHEGNVIEIPIKEVSAVDTTGAGDLYAAGFLYGLTQGWDVKRAGNLGSHFASEIIARIGVDMEEIDTAKIVKDII